jgi:hypothetical protein
MAEGAISIKNGFSIKRVLLIIVITWILSLATTVAIVYYSPNIFPPLKPGSIADSAIITTKLADGSVSSAKILDGTITAVDIADGSIISLKVADGAITMDKLSNSSVDSSKIADNAIVTMKLADGAVTSAKILDGSITTLDLATGSVTAVQIADGAVTNDKLAAEAIPFVSANSSELISTTETAQFVDMNGMTVTLQLNRKSHILIFFSVVAMPDWDQRIFVRALINGTVARPGEVWLTPIVYTDTTDSHFLGWGAYTFNFDEPSAIAGTYTIKIQWQVSGGTGDAVERILTVVALPA